MFSSCQCLQTHVLSGVCKSEHRLDSAVYCDNVRPTPYEDKCTIAASSGWRKMLDAGTESVVRRSTARLCTNSSEEQLLRVCSAANYGRRINQIILAPWEWNSNQTAARTKRKKGKQSLQCTGGVYYRPHLIWFPPVLTVLHKMCHSHPSHPRNFTPNDCFPAPSPECVLHYACVRIGVCVYTHGRRLRSSKGVPPTSVHHKSLLTAALVFLCLSQFTPYLDSVLRPKIRQNSLLGLVLNGLWDRLSRIKVRFVDCNKVLIGLQVLGFLSFSFFSEINFNYCIFCTFGHTGLWGAVNEWPIFKLMS